MTIRVAINGFGRIGRMVLRAIIEQNHSDIEVIAINDLGSIESNTHLFKYDSVHGRFQGNVITTSSTIDVGHGPISVLAQANPELLPWDDMNIDLVLECSGHFTKKETALKHITAGAKRVLVSAPTENADITVVYGVNHHAIQAEHQVISNASCTTNCLAPVAYVLNKEIGIEMGYMTTIHAYTGDQRLVDTLHSDLRRARAAAYSMIPTSTGAAKAVGLVLPKLKGKLDGTSIRVPTANVSAIDFTFTSNKKTSPAEINQALQNAAHNELQNVLGVVSEPLVSIDFNHDSHSAIFDLTQTQVIEGNFCRVLAWYDNEWGFSNRMCDVALHIKKFL